jgi:hypothetical protein
MTSMRPKFSLKTLLWLVAVVNSGCVLSKTIVGGSDQWQADDDLFGKWIIRDEPKGEFYIGRVPKEQRGKSPMQICGVGSDEKQKTVGVTSMALYPVRLGDRKYATIAMPDNWTSHRESPSPEKAVGDAENQVAYFIVKYEVSGDTLTFWLMDIHELQRDIAKGRIKGSVLKRVLGIAAVCGIDDTPENLAKYIKAADDRSLFPDGLKMVYTRTDEGPQQ